MAQSKMLKQLHSRQWSCSELASGMGHLVRCKAESSEQALSSELQDALVK